MATPQSEQIQILNKMTKIIDEKVTKYKKDMKTMSTNRFYSEKKLLLDTIENAIKLAESIKPPPPGVKDVIADFKKVSKDISGLRAY
ncbi:MAG TPA: hypothetical protein PK079_01040 [Leptospiraceae bacterium]|nr:hypothetical protein [Leptospiraceae bacterium]HMW03902.1 hypothetical protein [Leptospiraceae bacterium]HMX32384.1 hypothetical protein [Leptospiraceae bacterium]HMY29882.1 hypothetical protein [Leptospiraceae bacterium]HMZ62974.1 hypothetical protein [Leptospiraceae bacterium]